MDIFLRNAGPIQRADISLGDLTILVGPQASGKSIYLQFCKLAIDSGAIVKTLRNFGYQWSRSPETFLLSYFGEGMNKLFKADTELLVDGHSFDLENRIRRVGFGNEKVLFIPAQRVLTIADEWPRPFGSYPPGYPYVFKAFSEWIRVLMDSLSQNQGEDVFPKKNNFKKAIRESLSHSIFREASIKMDRGLKRRMLMHVHDTELPLMSWSAGQKEFVLLLLALQWLSPGSRTPKKKGIEFVVIEEPEMGLHPSAIRSVFLSIAELVHRGYRVVLSTHSSSILELAWVFMEMKSVDQKFEKEKIDLLLELFELPSNLQTKDLLKSLIEKSIRSYFFNQSDNGVQALDISSLNPEQGASSDSGWGGLLEFSSKANQIVSNLWGLK